MVYLIFIVSFMPFVLFYLDLESVIKVIIKREPVNRLAPSVRR